MIAQVTESFESYMKKGHEALRTSHSNDALEAFQQAESQASEGDQLSAARQMAGIAHRKLRQLTSARDSLIQAVDTPGISRRQKAAAMNDLGMVYLDFGDASTSPEEKRQAFEFAQSYFYEAQDMFITMRDTLGHGVSLGFLGRADCLRGTHSGHKRGITRMRRADKMFRTHPVFRLNNRIWLIRFSALDRWLRLPFTLYLTLAYHENRARFKEVIATLLGQRAYRSLKKKFR